MKTLLVLILAISLCITVAWADFTRADKVLIHDLPLITGKEVYQASPMVNNESAPPVYPQMDVIGDIDTVGTTWYDYQHNGTAGRMIAIDDQGSIHVVWMNGLQELATDRHVYYNMHHGDSLTGIWNFGNTGIAVESQIRSGYTCLSIDGAGYPYPTFHIIDDETNPDAQACVARDLFYGAGAFNYWLPPLVSGLEVIWPKSAIDINNRIHMVNTENPRSGVAGDPQRLYYIGGEYDPSNMIINFDPAQVEIDWVEVIAADLAASRTSDRVALVYHDIKYDILPPPDTAQFNNDVYLIISEDGINWDFNNPINVTAFLDPDTTLLPDTLAANTDTLRAYCDANIIFDYNDEVNVAFTVRSFYAIEGGLSYYNFSMIFSWNESYQNFGRVADGFWWDSDPALRCGAWQLFVQRPQLAVDEARGEMYCTWMQYDTADIAANLFPQADAMVAWSDCEGRHWSEPTNITDTHAPGGEPGHCMHERDITLNETIEDDYLHMLYVMDKDAGGIPQDEGTWTLNPVYYHRVPIDEISHDRIGEFSFPMHIDSTDFPPPHINYVRQVDNEVPVSFQLAQNYPNPFNPTTNIRFDLNGLGHVSLKVYNVLGQEVATLVDGRLQAGTYEVPFDATELASGVYFYKLSSSTLTETRKMVLLK